MRTSFFTHDSRRSFMVNGTEYRRQMHRKPEPPVSMVQAFLAALLLVLFVAGVVCFAVGLSC